MRSYLVDGRSYEQNASGDWYLFEAGNPASPDYTSGLDLRSRTLGEVESARFDGDADFGDVPARHFVFDETDLANYASYTPERPSPEVEGDFYIARDGGYVLYVHSKETAPNRIYEVTEELSSIGEVPEITLPAAFAPMAEALDVGVDLARLLPPDTTLSGLIRYKRGIGVDYYSYVTPVRTNVEFLNFFRTFLPTDGWTVSHIGHIRVHVEQINCETAVECVILTKGGEQLVVSFGAGITVEYDHEHVFGPLKE